jgi:hypothetical protein
MSKPADDKLGHAKREIKALRVQVAQGNSRVAELTEALVSLRKPWDLTQILGAETRRLVENADRVLRNEPIL